MFRRFQTRFLQTTLAVVAVVGLAVLSGCGDVNHSPMESAQPTVSDGVQNTDGGLRLSFTPSGVHLFQAAGKIPAGATSSLGTSGVIPALTGGNLTVNFSHTDSLVGIRVVSSSFTVLPNAMDADTLITMTAYSGTLLEHVYVDFGPNGLRFTPSSVLVVTLEGDFTGINTGTMIAYHHYADGTVELTTLTVSIVGDHLIMEIGVPGFSGYSPGGGGDDPPEGSGP
ncbi:MAG: hypothetical protein O2954_07900 [bacterium]|nr:hypothetical protein [bacterium]